MSNHKVLLNLTGLICCLLMSGCSDTVEDGEGKDFNGVIEQTSLDLECVDEECENTFNQPDEAL